MPNEFIARKGLIVSGSTISTGGFTGSLAGSSSFATTASYAVTSSFATNAAAVSTLLQNVSASGNIAAGTNLISNFSSGDEGGEIILARPQTNTSISGSVTIDVYQNRVRIFEANSPNRGGYYDITALASGVGTNLASGGGTVTSITAGNGLTGGTITGVGTITLDTGSAHFITGSVSASRLLGVVSSSAQINTGSFTGSFSGLTTSASLAATASGLFGGTVNYIPLWSSGTQQSSSAIFQSASNIGIGTTTPGTKLDVNGNLRAVSSFTTYTSDGLFNINATPSIFNTPGSSVRIGYQDFGGGQYLPAIGFSSSTTNWSLGIQNSTTRGDFSIGLNNRIDYLYISSSGAVGIGTSTPFYLLDVNSNVGILGSNYLYMGHSAAGTNWTVRTRAFNSQLEVNSNGLNFNNSGYGGTITWLFGNSSGNVGIGTSSPDANLTVFGQASFNSGSLSNPGVAARGDLNTGMYFPSADTIGFVEGGVEAMRIDSSGNVGIGTSSPTSILHVAQSVTTGSVVATFDNTHHSTSTAHTVEHNFRFRRDGGQQLDGAIIRAGKEGTWAGVGSETKAYLSFLTRPDFTTASLERVRITSTGTVGIGTSTPGATLHVQGNVSASSFTGSFAGTATSASFASTASGLIGGTTNYIPLWSSATAQSSSAIFQSGGNIGIGTISPGATLHVQGNVSASLINSIGVGRGAGSVSSNTAIGLSALTSNTTGGSNTAIGLSALAANTMGSNNTALGASSLLSATTALQNTAIGQESLRTATSGSYNTAVGWQSAFSLTTGNENVSLGWQAGYNITTGGYNIAIGSQAGRALTTAIQTTAIGDQSQRLAIGNYNTSVGAFSLVNNASGSNVAIGFYALNASTTGIRNTAIGYEAGYLITTGTKNAIFGSYTGNQDSIDIRTSNNNIILSDGDGNARLWYDGPNNAWVFRNNSAERVRITSTGTVGIGTSAPGATLHVQGNVSASSFTGSFAGTATTASGLTGGTSNYIPLWTSGTQQSSSAIFQNAGNVGIGTISIPAGQKLRVAGGDVGFEGQYAYFVNANAEITLGGSQNSRILNSDSSNTLSISRTGASSIITISTAGSERIRVNSTGNVGIGTTTPNTQLSVNGSTNITGSLAVTGATTSSAVLISGSGTQRLTVVGSGSAQPLFSVQGSQGELFSIVDSMSGSLFSVNDISGLPILEVFSDDTILIGDYQAPALHTTRRLTLNTGNNVIYSVPTSSYDSIHIEYNIKSGSNGRAGSFSGLYVGTTSQFTDASTLSVGSTANVRFEAFVSGANLVVTGSVPTNNWTLKAIIRAI